MIFYDLDTRLLKTIEYCKNNKMGYNMIQYYLVDGLTRYIDYYKDKTKLVDCIKHYNIDDQCKLRYNEINQILIKHNITQINETIRLLLIQAIYLEQKYNIKKIENQNV